jgi:signal transduction histidine kinase
MSNSDGNSKTSQKNKITILYVEDNPLNAKLIKRILTAFGYNLIIAETGTDGIDATAKHKPDLILMDIDLPDMTGFEATLRIREMEEFRKTPVLAVTAQVAPDYREMAKSSSIAAYLTKPINIDLLTQKIQEHLGKKSEEVLPVDVETDSEETTYDKQTVRQLVNKVRELENQNTELLTNNRKLVEQLVSKLREMEETNEELRRLDRIKDDFIQRTAHEIRTPLTVIVGYNRLIQSSAAFQQATHQDELLSSYVLGLDESIDRMRRVVDEIVMVSRLAIGKIEIVATPNAPFKVIQAAIEPFADVIARRNIKLNVMDSARWPPKFSVDADLVCLALINIVSNAIKYTPDGGKISISGKKLDEKYVRITIKDSGIGIDPDEQERIFERFYSTGDIKLHSTSKTAFQGGGLGLGLATCKAILEAHGGRISVESAGKDEKKLPGSSFHIDLLIEHKKKEVNKAEVYRSW